MKKYLVKSYFKKGSRSKGRYPRPAAFDTLAAAKGNASKRSRRFDVVVWRTSDKKKVWSRDAA